MVAIPKSSFISDFKAFITRGNVVDLAVGIIIGAAFTAIVNSLVKDLISPFIGLATGGIDFSNMFVTLKGPVMPSLAEAQKAGAVTFNYGSFLNSVIQFLIVSFVIFVLVRVLTKLRVRQDAAPAAPSTTDVLLTEIRDLLATGRAS
ncbi:large conductance mechanosensitive channel [Endobacter medicaginis]|uniref:Large-conductance mechanosensitive channel n=1 Tax=Endobacter medicaginis TaxID=1181271 RepID=A0A839UZ20_9PROT|nr:large conductance mechanosensitive channel protein MscL [Endobacter medicaginis]MBB3172632.1 large conductance mechanosensitive channel [Endobacter medicaginis]MCX5476758.1 large conductance mechanosensitive channel protein MscL [Endobacter medicaginis]NVN30791.1 large conductance mechanosensitive channel protein MscL [Endobacter medicaginis]